MDSTDNAELGGAGVSKKKDVDEAAEDCSSASHPLTKAEKLDQQMAALKSAAEENVQHALDSHEAAIKLSERARPSSHHNNLYYNFFYYYCY